MNATTRLAVFAAALVAIFAISWAMGAAWGPSVSSSEPASVSNDSAHVDDAHAAAPGGRG